MVKIAHLPIWQIYIQGEEVVLFRMEDVPLLPGHMAPTLRFSDDDSHVENDDNLMYRTTPRSYDPVIIKIVMTNMFLKRNMFVKKE